MICGVAPSKSGVSLVRLIGFAGIAFWAIAELDPEASGLARGRRPWPGASKRDRAYRIGD